MVDFPPLDIRGRIPITLFVDDATPYVNLYYQYIRQVEFTHLRNPILAFGPDREIMEDRIPLDLLWKFGELISEFDVRGKISLVPFPAGFGSIAQEIQGVSKAELDAFLGSFRNLVVSQFDVTPEMLTHTRKLDLGSLTLDHLSEEAWSRDKSVSELHNYMAQGISILRNVGLEPNGVTSPMDFGAGNEQNYEAAIVKCFASEGDTGVTWYFLHQSGGCPVQLRPKSYVVGGRKHICVHIPATVTDYLMELYNLPAAHGTRELLADKYISRDGCRGEIVQQVRQGSDLISLLVHWPCLYLNGRYDGLRVLREILGRISTYLSESVIWMTPHQIATIAAQRLLHQE